MRKIIPFILTLCLLAALIPVLAAEPGEARVVIGADLSEAEINTVYTSLGIARGSVPELTLTNAEERQSLAGLVDESVIGTRSISCVYLRLRQPGEGCGVSAGNVNWCTPEMYRNALVTAGVEDVDVIVTAPFTVSGTAALAGIYKAYEDMTGAALDTAAKAVGTQELVITGDLAEEIGSYDAGEIVNELKLILDETKSMTDDEIAAEIRSIAGEYNVSLNDSQVSQLVSLCRSMERLGDSELTEKVRSLQDKVKKMGELADKAKEVGEKVEETRDKLSGAIETVKKYTQPVIDFFKGLFSRGD